MPEPARKLPDEDQPEISPPFLRSMPGGGEGGGPSSRDAGLEAVRDAEENPDDDAPMYGPAAPTARQQKSLDRYARDKEQAAADAAEYEEKRRKKVEKREFKFRNTMEKGSGLRKKMAIAGVAAGGSVAVGIIAFVLLLPLKIEHILTNIEEHFGAATTQALDNQAENLYSNYVARQVLPNFNKKDCHSTVDATCVSLSSDTGPIGRLYNSWTQGKLENKLATKYNIVIGKKGSQLYMNMDGYFINNADMRRVQTGRASLFDLPGTRATDRSTIRLAVRDSLKEATLYDRVYTRFKLGKLLEEKYGIKRCVLACNIRDKFSESTTAKKSAAKAYLVRRVVTPVSESYGLIFQCLLNPGTCDNAVADNGSTNDPEKTTNFQRQLQNQLDSFATQYGSDALEKLVQDSNTISKDGFSKYVMSRVISKVVGQEVTTETINSIANPLSWITKASKAIGFVNEAGKLTAFGYSAAASGAVATTMTFATVVSEMHSGHTDATMVGSFVDQLDNNGVDMTATPAYQDIVGGNGSSSVASSLLPSASAATTSMSSDSKYICDNGKPVPAGQEVCTEEDFGNPTGTLAATSKLASHMPSILTDAASIANSKYSPLSWFSALGNFATKYTPGVSNLAGFLGGFAAQLITPLFNYLTSLLPSPFHDPDHMSGGRTGDMMIAGEDVLQNKGCQTQLGCAKVTPQQSKQIQQAMLDEKKLEFERQPMFARMFNVNDSYSLISRLADSLPLNPKAGAYSFIGSLLSNPFGKLAASFGNMFHVGNAFAAGPAQDDPFGIAQYGWTQSQLDQLNQAILNAGGYEKYWQQNCSGDYTTPWVNQQTTDSVTGDAVSTTPNACMLINASVQSTGGTSDSSLLPAGSQTSDDNLTSFVFPKLLTGRPAWS